MIAVIRGSADADAARETLMSEFGLSEVQARAILDLRLRALTALQQDEVRREHGELVALVTELRSILADEARVYAIVKEELSELGNRFGDDRRTEIVPAEGELDLEQLIREEDMVISITQTGYIKRVAASTYRQQKRGGVGVMGMDTKDDDWIEHLLVASTHDYVLFFTSVGKVYRLKVHELPRATARAAAAPSSTCCRCARASTCARSSPRAISARTSISCRRPRTGSSRRRCSRSTTRRASPTASSRSTSVRATS